MGVFLHLFCWNKNLETLVHSQLRSLPWFVPSSLKKKTQQKKREMNQVFLVFFFLSLRIKDLTFLFALSLGKTTQKQRRVMCQESLCSFDLLWFCQLKGHTLPTFPGCSLMPWKGCKSKHERQLEEISVCVQQILRSILMSSVLNDQMKRWNSRCRVLSVPRHNTSQFEIPVI